MTLVILSGGIDLSVGSVLELYHDPGGGADAAPSYAAAAGDGLGLRIWNALGSGMGFLIDRFDLPPFLVTLGRNVFCARHGFMISPESVGIEHPFYSRLAEISISVGRKASLLGDGVDLPVNLFALGILLTHQTPFGRNIYAAGRKRIVGAVDGCADWPDQTGGLCGERFLRGAGGSGFHDLYRFGQSHHSAWGLNWMSSPPWWWAGRC